MKLLADEIDHETGIITRIWRDDDGELWSEQLHDAQAIVDLNHALATTEAPGRDIRLAASVPPLVMNQWMTAHTRGEGPAPWEPEWNGWLNRKLNDVSHRKFRVHGGRL